MPELDVRPAQRVQGIGVVQPITVETMIHLLPIHYNLLPHQNASVTSKQIRGNIPATNPTVTAALKVSDPIIGGGAGASIAASIAVAVVPVIAIPVPYALPPFRWNEADIDTEIE